MFVEMLAIKHFREQQAELTLSRQRQRRVEAVQEADQARRLLETYRDWAQEQERSMYRDLCERVVRPRDIEDVLSQVANLRKNEVYYASESKSADEKLGHETQVLAECQGAHAQTVRMTKKFTELAEAYWDDVAQIQNKKEDNELEEVASLSGDRSDWISSEGEDL